MSETDNFSFISFGGLVFQINFVVGVVFTFAPKPLDSWSHCSRVSAMISGEVKMKNEVTLL